MSARAARAVAWSLVIVLICSVAWLALRGEPDVVITEQQQCTDAGGMFVALPSGKTLCTSTGPFR